MTPNDATLQRLLQSAALVSDEPGDLPFGFDTRVIALWRAAAVNGGNGISRLVGRVAMLAAFVLLVSGAASFREYRQTEEAVEPTSNEFAIADSAIEDEFFQ
jgi:hypothetical protein